MVELPSDALSRIVRPLGRDLRGAVGGAGSALFDPVECKSFEA